MGMCRYCGENAGFLRSQHGECGERHDEGVRQMTSLAADVAVAQDFSRQALHESLEAIARVARADRQTVLAAVGDGWAQAVDAAMSDGLLNYEEERRLNTFRNAMLRAGVSGIEGAVESMRRGALDRLEREARTAALSCVDGKERLSFLERSLSSYNLGAEERRDLLVRAWESAVHSTLEDRVLTVEEEGALARYLDHHGLSADDVDANGCHRRVMQASVIRDLLEGILPNRENLRGQVPFNLMKSETLVWVMDGVRYFETVTRRERRGSSHGVSVRVARGLYYSPRTFSSRSVEWEETVHLDTGLMGFTTKHIYFAGSRQRFRVRYDRIVAFEPYSDGLGIMREAQTAKPQTFVTGDGWFVYNLAVNLAQM